MADDSVPQYRHPLRRARHYTASNIRGTNQDLTIITYIHVPDVLFYLIDIQDKIETMPYYNLTFLLTYYHIHVLEIFL